MKVKCENCIFIKGVTEDIGLGYCSWSDNIVFLEDQCMHQSDPVKTMTIWISNTEPTDKTLYRKVRGYYQKPVYNSEKIGYEGAEAASLSASRASGDAINFMRFLEKLLPGLSEIYNTKDLLRITIDRIPGEEEK